MSDRLLRGGAIVSAGQVLTLGLSFSRNLVLAKLIGAENMGISAGFLATMSAVELASDIGMQKQVVQSSDADSPEFLGTAHSMMLIRGLILGLVLFLVAKPCAEWFQAPQAAWAFQLLSLVPIFKSLMNLDVIRIQRSMRFGPFVIVEVMSQVGALVAGVIAGMVTHSYSAVMVAVLAQSFLSGAVSHFVAKERYRLKWSPEHTKGLIDYGWPLMLSGILMFVGLFADRFIIGRAYGLVVLGNYALAFSLTNVPIQAATKILMSLFFPILSKPSGASSFNEHYSQVSQITASAAAAFGAVAILVLPTLIELAYDEEFAEAGTIVALISVMMVVRLLRTTQSQGLLALAETKGLLVSNVVRALGVPVAFGVASIGGSVEAVILIMLVAEVLALSTSAFWLKYARRVPLFPSITQQILAFGLVVTIFLVDRYMLESSLPVLRFGLATALTAGLAYHAMTALNGLRTSQRVGSTGNIAQPTG
ncbi:Teichuronic acid biosynthesis protein TuaB [Thalassoglobus neptunius]|uniref:Teichuronic acid biosynthesis protein TuaB n=1 Tax=Thalassoglobus neptunius TaxID=1938619 RepID=A0A5C5X1I6_9PLAN|nr:oligosaccharide flippase family protein [Thalassoglobus neptunius]TWT56738.1 Teichuronic acid biosynthesis protein TuaB [Thalassoglobus neptunius]